MASGVFGTPVTVETVKATGKYKEPITQKDVADYAMEMINAGGKDVNAQQFVDNLKNRYGDGISAKCLIYNATGTTLRFVTYTDWQGHIYDTPYPSEIQSGQWGAYLHVHPTALAKGSIAAVVYRSEVPDSKDKDSRDWLFCWRIPFTGSNSVYTEIREEGHFPPDWNSIHSKLDNSGRSSTASGYGYVSDTDIGEGTTVNVRATFKLE